MQMIQAIIMLLSWHWRSLTAIFDRPAVAGRLTAQEV
jgi:hypothetical protein